MYYHGPIPLDYMFLSSELIYRTNRQTRSVVDKFMIWAPFFFMMRAFGCFAGTRKVG